MLQIFGFLGFKVLSVVRFEVCLKCLAQTVSVPCRQSGLANMRGLSHKGKGLPQAALRDSLKNSILL